MRDFKENMKGKDNYVYDQNRIYNFRNPVTV